MRFPPATVMLTWPSPNHVDPIERGPALIIVELTSLSIALFVLCLRLYVRFFIIRRSWWDDWLMIVASLFADSSSWLIIPTVNVDGHCCHLRLCIPAWHYWDLFVENRKCLDEWPPLAAQSVSTVVIDVIVYIIPIPTLFRLKLPAAQRLVLMFLFSLGTVVVVAGAMRTYWIHHVEKETYDVTWEGFELWIWTALEANLAVVCGCVPVLRPLLLLTSDCKSPNLVERSSPPTIGSGEKEKGKRDDLGYDAYDAGEDMLSLVNTTLSTPSNSFNTPFQLSSPGWSPILDEWARRQHQKQFRR
ncbi:uncharacterized protein LY79DRAFT_594815 [Colletotrichum navitas]|uniref:Rhodopsin domain-containing protein n=1 Tax=Colletotrichum navitas TaxID=681940 RepID=A0AAD8PKN3_9PEZI|nr:uncharacterized protein LY79DRAFT_594815 [Colletotrichum navitas]KAK1569563.1 hypothetical protein LY79DRAFT_594815 [Colletotrichum navitas]